MKARFFAFVVLSCSFLPLSAEDDIPVSLLFVQSAGGVSFDAAAATLTLKDVLSG